MVTENNTQVSVEQIEKDYDYIASLYTHLYKVDALKSVHGFERGSEEMVGTFFYSLSDTKFIYINPCVGCYLCGEALDASIQVSVLDVSESENQLLADFHVEFNVQRDLTTDADNYTKAVNDILSLVAMKV